MGTCRNPIHQKFGFRTFGFRHSTVLNTQFLSSNVSLQQRSCRSCPLTGSNWFYLPSSMPLKKTSGELKLDQLNYLEPWLSVHLNRYNFWRWIILFKLKHFLLKLTNFYGSGSKHLNILLQLTSGTFNMKLNSNVSKNGAILFNIWTQPILMLPQ